MSIPTRKAVFRLILPAALFWLIPASGLASSTRLGSLGGSGGFLEDDNNLLRWYGSLIDYPDLALIETGHFDLSNGYDDDWGRSLSGPGGGVHVQFDQAGRWGTGALYFHGRADDSDPGSLHRGYLGGSVSLFYAHQVGGVSGTVMYRHTADTESRSDPQVPAPSEATYNRTRDDIGLGARFNVSDRAYLDLAADIRHLSDRASGQDPANGDWNTGDLGSWNNYGLRARGFIGLNDRLALVPLAEYIGEDFTGTSFVGTGLVAETSANSGGLFRLGAGLDFFIDADNFLLFSTEYLDGQADHSVRGLDGAENQFWQEDYSVFLMRLAFETRLAHWITVRASSGYEHMDNQGDLPNPATGEHIPLGLGLGLHVGTLVVDLALTDREPQGVSRFSATLPATESATWLSITLSYGF